MINYFYDCYCILNKVYSEKTFFKQALSSTFIEEKNRSLTVKTCYGVLDKDIELSYYISKLCGKSPKLVIRTVLKIAMYAIKYLNKHGYAVTQNAVELVKKLGKCGTAGFVNAFLRKFLSTAIPLPVDIHENLSTKYSFPLFAVKELCDEYGVSRTEKILSAQNEKTCLRFFKVNGKDYLTKLGVEFVETPFDNVFIAEKFVRNLDYDLGIYTYQALGSVAICDLVKPCERLLDCCAAPGGKSIALSSKCKSIVSWDIHAHRVSLINDYKRRVGVDNITCEITDASLFQPNLVEGFDAVLCDAPCSGMGVVNDNPDIKLNRTSENIDVLCKTQLEILKTVSNYVKKGGFLYYSTCSILARENIGIIKSFMTQNNGFEICELDSKLPFERQDGTIKFLPDISGGLGFYVAILRKI